MLNPGNARIIGPKDGEPAGKPGVIHDRFLIIGHETDGRFAAVFKPWGQWHTFWNGGDTPARILELTSPGGSSMRSATWTRWVRR